jgi:hypothetical protein
MTADFSTWYAGISLAITLLILAIAAFAFHSALGGPQAVPGRLPRRLTPRPMLN